MAGILETISHSELVHIDPERDVVFETPSADAVSTINRYFESTSRCSDSRTEPSSPASDSDSGNSLFLTQSVTPAVRTVKRHHSSEKTAHPFSLGSDDECERGHDKENGSHTQEKSATVSRRESDSDFDEDFVSGLRKTDGSRRQSYKRQRAHSLPTRNFSFLPNPGLMSYEKNQSLVNSEIGGFFKCVRKFSNGNQRQRKPLCSSLFSSVLRKTEEIEEELEEDHDSDYDIRVVGVESFITKTTKRNRQSWLPDIRWKSKLSSNTPSSKSCTRDKKKKESEKGKRKDTRKQKAKQRPVPKHVEKAGQDAQANTKPLSDTEISLLSSDDEPPLIQEEQSEERLEVLATCSQTESLDLHCRRTPSEQELPHNCENSDDDRVVQETQMPEGSGLSSEEGEETHSDQILTDRLREQSEDETFVENILHERDENAGEDHENHELQETEVLVPGGDVYIASQDLFRNQDSCTDAMIASSPIKDIRDHSEEVRESSKGIYAERSERKEDSETQLEIFLKLHAGSHVNNNENSELQISSESLASESILPRVENLKETFEENPPAEETPVDDRVPLTHPEESVHFEHPTLSLADDLTNVDSNPSKDLITDEQADMTVETEQSPLFKNGAPSLLKSRKRKTSTLSDTSQNESLSWRENQKMSDRLGEDYKSEKNVESKLNHGTSGTELVKENAKVYFLEDKERQVEEILPTNRPQSETLNSCNPDPSPEQALLCLDLRAGDLVTPRKKKKKRKREHIFEDNVSETTQIEIEMSQQAEILEDIQDLEQLAEEQSVKKKKKKKKKHRDENVDKVAKQTESVGTLEVVQEFRSPERKLKKKRMKLQIVEDMPVDAPQVETTEQVEALKVVQDSSQQTELFPEKKKEKNHQIVVKENVSVDASWVEIPDKIEALEVVQHSEQQATEFIPKKRVKKKKKYQVFEEASQTETAEQVESLEVVQNSERQAPESVPEHKVTKNMSEQDFENSVAVKAYEAEANPQAETQEMVQDSERDNEDSELQTSSKCLEPQASENISPRVSVETLPAQETPVVDSVSLTHPEESVQFQHPASLLTDDLTNVDSNSSKDLITGEQAEITVESEHSPMFNYSGLSLLKRRKRKKSILSNVNQNDILSQFEDVSLQKNRKISAPLDKDYKCDVNVGSQSAHCISGTELVNENPKVYFLEDQERQVKDILSTSRPQSETLNSCNPDPSPEQPLHCLDLQADDLVTPKKKKKKRKREHIFEDNVSVGTTQIEIEMSQQAEILEDIQDLEQSSELTEGQSVKKKKKKKMKKHKDENVDIVAKQTDQVEALEVVQEFTSPEKKLKKKRMKLQVVEDVTIETPQEEITEQVKAQEVVQDSSQQTELISEKSLKKKKKKHQFVEENVSVDASWVEIPEQVEALEVVQDSLQQTELIPEKSLKKKKRKHQFVEENVSVDASQVETTEQVGALEVVQEFRSPERKLKKKRVKLNVVEDISVDGPQVETREQVEALEVVQDSLHQTELISEKSLKKKKKKHQLVEESAPVDAFCVGTPVQVEALEVVQEFTSPEKNVKKKRVKLQVVEVSVGAPQVETTEKFEALKVVQDSPQQIELISERKLKKKRHQVVEENVSLDASCVGTPEQVDALEVVQDSEQQSTELISEKKVKKNKKHQGFEEAIVESLEDVQNSEKQAPESILENKIKKKKKSKQVAENDVVEAGQVESKVQVDTQEMDQDFEQQSTELIPQNKLKKKRKQENTETELALEASHIDTVLQVESQEVGDFEKQGTDLDLAKTVKKKKKKKKEKERVAEENMISELETTEQVDNLEMHSEQEVLKKKEKKKKKREHVKDNDDFEASQVETTEQTTPPEVIQSDEDPKKKR